MNVRFANFARHVGHRGKYDWFKWVVFVDEEPEVLAEIEGVEYRLHETFPNPVRYVTNPEEQFALVSSGWGEFTIFATVLFKNGEEKTHTHKLDLGKPWPEEAFTTLTTE